MNDETGLTRPVSDLRFFSTPSHACGYFPDRQAMSVVADPAVRLSDRLFGALAELGFRRSGEHLYRPHCAGCRACIPVRVPVQGFAPDRSQRRTWRRNQDLQVRRLPATFHVEHFELYRRYIRARHPGGSMDYTSTEEYLRFISSPWPGTALYEFRDRDKLRAVALVDEFSSALSAVYTFYAPEVPERALGVYAVLWQIETARRRGMRWVYLGYWIKESAKMAYKSRYRPLEYFDGQAWRELDGPP